MTVNVDTPENTGDASNTSPRQQLAPTQKADAKHQAEPSNWLARAQTIANWLWRHIPTWAKRWDFALVLALGALLRLLWLDDTAFLGDQAQLLSVARSAVDHSAFIFTGIPSSIGSLNPPLTVWILAPFAWLGDPIWATLETALANIAAVALLYALADRYMGRRAAFAAGLLYATASGPVTYARFIWQQNLLAPFLLLFILTICWGLIERRHGWLGWNLLFWGVAVELHTTAAPLILLTLVTALLARATLRWRDAIFGAVALALLIAPTILWQFINQASDITAFRAYGMQTPVIDGAAISWLLKLLTPPQPFSYSSFYYQTPGFQWIVWLGPLLLLIFVAAQVWLAASIVARVPLLRMLRRSPDAPASFGATLADRRWLFLLVAALWQDTPILFLVRHNAIYEHYLLTVAPALFLILGLFLAEASRWVGRRSPALAAALAQRLRGGMTARLRRRRLARDSGARRAGLAALALLLALLAGAQSYDVLAQLTALHQGAFDGAVNPAGMPLSAERALLSEASSAAGAAHLPLYVASPYSLQMPLGYLSASGDARDAANVTGAAAVYDAANCVLLPAAGTTQSIATVTIPSVTADTVLRRASGAGVQQIGTLSVDALPLYRVAPGARASDELPVTAANATTTANPAAVATLTPTTYALDSDVDGRQALFVRWSGDPPPLKVYGKDMSYWFGAQPGAAAQTYADYWFYAEPFDAQGHAIRAPLTGLCPRLVWPHGMDMMTWIRLPLGFGAGAVATWRVWMAGESVSAHRPSLGPIALETGDLRIGPLTPLSASTTIRIK